MPAEVNQFGLIEGARRNKSEIGRGISLVIAHAEKIAILQHDLNGPVVVPGEIVGSIPLVINLIAGHVHYFDFTAGKKHDVADASYVPAQHVQRVTAVLVKIMIIPNDHKTLTHVNGS